MSLHIGSQPTEPLLALIGENVIFEEFPNLNIKPNIQIYSDEAVGRIEFL
jgi:hypothetical protein